jgi:DnaJ-like protein
VEEQDHYSLLQLTSDASPSEIQAAYERLASAEAGEAVDPNRRKSIEAAYEELHDPIRRLRYDARQTAPPPSRFEIPSVSLPKWRLQVGPAARSSALVLIALLVVAGALILVGRGKPASAPVDQSSTGSIGVSTPTSAPSRPTPNGAATAPSLGIFELPRATPTPTTGSGLPVAAAPTTVPIVPPGLSVGPARASAVPSTVVAAANPLPPRQAAPLPLEPPSRPEVPVNVAPSTAAGVAAIPNRIFVPTFPNSAGGPASGSGSNRFVPPPANGR